MYKKGQVTIFIIIAIVIVGIIAMYFVIKEKTPKIEYIDPEIKPVYNFVEDCLKQTAENGLLRIGQQGGYFIIDPSTVSINEIIPYYLIDNNSYLVSNEQIELNLAGFVREELGFCILNFKDFKTQYNVTSELKQVTSSISDNKVKFILDYPLTISKIGAKSIYRLENFEIELPIRLGIITDVSNEIVDEQVKHPESICLSCLYDLDEKNNLSIDLFDYGNSTIFTVIDDNSKINNHSYEWSFAIK